MRIVSVNATIVHKEKTMKMTLVSVTSSWLCATGVAVISSYCILTHGNGAAGDQKKAAQVAYRVSKSGTIPEYKPTNRHSSAVKKTTTAKVAQEIKIPKFVQNPIYAPFTNALSNLTEELADAAKDGGVMLVNGFALMNKDGKPTLEFPEEYTKVGIGGVAIGDELKGAFFLARRKGIEGTDQYKIDEVALYGYRRLDEPEFYCTRVTYSVLPSTRQVDSIRMHGDLCVGNASKANKMVREITRWMKEDFGAVDRRSDVPDGALALKKFRIGKGMDVEVAVNWKKQRADDGSDASIDISFTASELVEDNRIERQMLGDAADEARVNELGKSGVNYYTVRPRVKEDDVKKKVVY